MNIVQKFGGTSVGSSARIRRCASLIEREILNNNFPCVVVSAMSGQTNMLLNLTEGFHGAAGSPFSDLVASTGEVVSSGLLALALHEIGIQAQPLSCWQVPILTDQTFGNAKIIDIFPQKIKKLMREGIVPVITGFQGMTLEYEVTTLGRGGSDTSAVAIAAAIGAQRCDIYTDVDGIYSADPRFVPQAIRHESLPYDIAMEMASLGSKVLHSRCVEIAKRYGMPLRVLSSFNDAPGTHITQEVFMENKIISSITHTRDMVWVTFPQATFHHFLETFTKLSAEFDMLQLNQETFGCSLSLETWGKISSFLEKPLELQTNLSRISLIGQGLRGNPEVLQKTLKIMKDLPIKAIDMTQARLSLLTRCDTPEILVQTLHDALILKKD